VQLSEVNSQLKIERVSRTIAEGKNESLCQQHTRAQSELEEEKSRYDELSQSLERYGGIAKPILTLLSFPSIDIFVVRSVNNVYFACSVTVVYLVMYIVPSHVVCWILQFAASGGMFEEAIP